MTAPLDTGPWCSACQVHRAQVSGGRCPSCLADAVTEARKADQQ